MVPDFTIIISNSFKAQASLSFSAKSISSDTLPKYAKGTNKKQRFISRIKERAKYADKNNSKAKQETSIESSKTDHEKFFVKTNTLESRDSVKSKKSNKRAQIDTLILVVHGGNVTCTDTSKINDFSNFKSTMTYVIKAHYGHMYGRFAFRLVACEPICKSSLLNLAA